MKVLLATGHEELDGVLKEMIPKQGIEVVGTCLNRIVLSEVAKELDADTIILSGLLKGDAEYDLITLVKKLREEGIRVVVLPGSLDMEKTKQLVTSLVPYGVYDYVFDELTPGDIIERLKNPAVPKDIPNALVRAAMEQQSVSQEVSRQVENQLQIQKRIKTKLANKQQSLKSRNSLNDSPPTDTILLATGDEAINESIATSISSHTVMVDNRESLLPMTERYQPGMVILSPLLPGDIDILEVVYQVRQVSKNIIFIAGQTPSTDITLLRIKELQVEVLTGEISIGTILQTLFKATGATEKEYSLSDDEPDEEEDGGEGSLSKFARAGTEMVKNLSSSISVSKIALKRKKTTVNDKVVAVVSPVSTGKTFIAVNLATTLAQMGFRVVLVDGEVLQQSTHTWLNVSQDEKGIIDAMETDDPLTCSYQHPMLSNLYVLNKDPFSDSPFLGLKSMIKILNSLNESDEVDVIIIDTYRNMAEPFTKAIIETASQVILVADLDFSHLTKMQADLDKMENSLDFNKFSLLVNRVVDSDYLGVSDAEKATGLQADGVIPERTKEVLESIKNGIPAALFCPEIKMAFEDFWSRREQELQALA
ncbi:hypothetical protein V6C32_01040 [Desulforamulus ruminis]|uniref:nucleotide-binding protein n=1 Tax=Desulforamulus ruminis TaxID=1564 RepID=UPI002FDA7D3E